MLKTVADAWRSLIGRGILLVLIGIAALAFPREVIWLVIAFAAFAIAHGLFDVVVALRHRSAAGHAAALGVEGAVWIVAGAATLHWLGTAFALGYIIALWAAGLGLAILLVVAATRAHVPHPWALALCGSASLAFGVWLLRAPAQLFLIGPALELGVVALLGGAATLVVGFQARHLKRNGALVASGSTQILTRR